MANWQFDGTDFDDLEVVSAMVTKVAGGMDSAVLTFAISATGTAPATLDADVDITAPDATVFFRGIVEDCRPGLTADGEQWEVTLGGRVKALDRIVYMQSRACKPASSGGAVVPKYDSSVILGWDNTGTRQTSAEMLDDVITYAGGQSSGVASGSLLSGTAITVPQMEMTDTTCLECIETILRWHPDSILWFDHALDEVNVTRPGSMSVESRAGTGNSAYCTSLNVAPRKVRSVRGVTIYWRITSTLDDLEHVDTVEDSAGATTGRDIIRITIPLAGPQTTTQAQEIVTLDIPQDETEVTGDWLTTKFPELAECAPGVGQLTVKSVTQEVLTDEEMGPGTTLSSYPRELLSGQIQPWMAGISACPVVVTIELAFTASRAANPKLYDRFFKGAKKAVKFQLRVTGTDATTREYTTSATVPGESPVTGLAADYYAAMNADQPEGSVVFEMEEVDADLHPGRKITLTGDKTVTGGIIQRADYDLFSGRTAVQFGPVGYRSPADLVELLRAGQRSRPLANSDGTFRTASEPSAATKIKGATGGRQIATGNVPEPKALRDFTVSMASSSSVTISGGEIRTPDITSITSPTVTPDKVAKVVTVTDDTIGVANGDVVYLKLTYVREEYETSDSGSDGFTTDGSDTFNLTWQAEQTVAVYVVSTGTFEVTDTPPTNTDLIAYIKLAEIDITDGVMTITQTQWGPVMPYPLTLPGPVRVTIGQA